MASETDSPQENTPKLNPTDGHTVAGVKIGDHLFLARAKAAQLFQFAPDPRETENRKLVDASKELQDLREVRLEVQRNFAGAKAENVPKYAGYIVGLHQREDGITPPIILYSQRELKVHVDEAGIGFIQIPWNLRLVAIDGETQLAARFEAANRLPETMEDFVPLFFCHGKNTAWARQGFFDLNVLAVRPNAALAIGMDARDPITKVAREVEEKVPFFRGRVNKVQRQLKTNDPRNVVTITSLRGSCVTLAEGIGGVRYGTRPVPIAEQEKIDRIAQVAVEWFNEVTKVLGPSIEDRANKIASAPSVMAAIGAMAQPLVNIANPEERRSRMQELLEKLRSVDWTKGPAWDGIAGKISPKGNFATGGSKETAYAVYAALNDPLSPGYNKIRNREAA